MIVLDTETSGVNREIHGLWQIGAFELENPSNTFLMECRIDDTDEVHPSSLLITGKTEDYYRDKKKISQKELIKKFFEWARKIKSRNIIGQNPMFDAGFLETKATKYGLFNPRVNANEEGAYPLPFRTFDLHSISQTIYARINGNIKIRESSGTSGMDLTSILKFCGIEDHRKQVVSGTIKKEGVPHNALEDAKLTGEAFSRLMYGKGLLPEFKDFQVPEYLKQQYETVRIEVK
jgi:DNA polymerase III epsilon subunit-like protein